MTKVICTTTINPPTEALYRFAAMNGWTLVVAGDLKTPHGLFVSELNRALYISTKDQIAYDEKLSEAIGWNCIQRRNFAFLWAVKELKADIIATVDDDNIPLDGWGNNLMVGRPVQCNFDSPDDVAFDPFTLTGIERTEQMWHRGFPVQLVTSRMPKHIPPAVALTREIQADFWNGEPDVDAICRLAMNTTNTVFFNDFFPIASDKPSPFNSQNTFLSKEVMPHYFMFPGIGRMDDIWASFHVQAQGFGVVYGKPSVVQNRNPHDIFQDMKQEMIGYEHNLEIIKAVPTDKSAVVRFLPEQARHAFTLYQKHFE